MTINKKLKKTNLVIIIPARLRSVRLSKKLVRKINNVPMVVRVAKSAINCKLGDVYVATDSKQIFNLCEKNKIVTIIGKLAYINAWNIACKIGNANCPISPNNIQLLFCDCIALTVP